MMKITNNRIKDLLSLQLLFVYYSLIGLISKKAAQYNFLSKEFIGLYVIELVMIFVYAYFWQKIIKKFSITTAYASKGIVILWTLLWSFLIFNETIQFKNIIGAVIIIVGIIVVSKNVR